ncbi:MAG: RNA-protein complex protein Nop10 [Candidatus Bathyarchaeia archaeon]
MVWLIKKCVNCKRYTLQTDKCPICGGGVHSPHPPKFSFNDKYLTYKLEMRKWKKQ